LYGHLAQQVDYTHSVSAAQVCGETGNVQFGGARESGRAAWMGLQVEAWRRLNLRPERWVGDMGLARPGALWHSPRPLTPVIPRFNALPRQLAGEPGAFVVEGRAAAAAAVLVSHRAYRYHPFSVTRARANGRDVAAVYADLTSSVFLPPGGDAEVDWQIEIVAVSDYVDVLSFDTATAAAEPSP